MSFKDALKNINLNVKWSLTMIFDFKCEKCDFKEEYFVSKSLPKELLPPDTCPKCGGKMIKVDNFSGIKYDIIGYCYENEYGKKAWRKNLSVEEQASVLTGDKDPY
jgi:hypothetical protein